MYLRHINVCPARALSLFLQNTPRAVSLRSCQFSLSSFTTKYIFIFSDMYIVRSMYVAFSLSVVRFIYLLFFYFFNFFGSAFTRCRYLDLLAHYQVKRWLAEQATLDGSTVMAQVEAGDGAVQAANRVRQRERGDGGGEKIRGIQGLEVER